MKMTIALLGFAITSAFAVAPLAQDAFPAPHDFPWATVGASGMLAWYLWYTTCKAFPRIAERHAAQIKELRDTYEKRLERVDAMLIQEQAQSTAAIDKLSVAIQGQSSTLGRLATAVQHVECRPADEGQRPCDAE